jgi:hypothetical protein
MKSETRTVGLPVASCRLVMPIQSFHISDPGFPALQLAFCLTASSFTAFPLPFPIRVHPRLILPASQTDSLVFPVSQSLLHKRVAVPLTSHVRLHETKPYLPQLLPDQEAALSSRLR